MYNYHLQLSGYIGDNNKMNYGRSSSRTGRRLSLVVYLRSFEPNSWFCVRLYQHRKYHRESQATKRRRFPIPYLSQRHLSAPRIDSILERAPTGGASDILKNMKTRPPKTILLLSTLCYANLGWGCAGFVQALAASPRTYKYTD